MSRGPREAVKSHLGQLKNQMDEVLSNLILTGLSLRKAEKKVLSEFISSLDYPVLLSTMRNCYSRVLIKTLATDVIHAFGQS